MPSKTSSNFINIFYFNFSIPKFDQFDLEYWARVLEGDSRTEPPRHGNIYLRFGSSNVKDRCNFVGPRRVTMDGSPV